MPNYFSIRSTPPSTGATQPERLPERQSNLTISRTPYARQEQSGKQILEGPCSSKKSEATLVLKNLA